MVLVRSAILRLKSKISNAEHFQIETTLDPTSLLDELQAIEVSMGRVKHIDKGPRNIDLDILLYDQEAVLTDRLHIPHHSMLDREFVLRPLSEYVWSCKFDALL